MLSLHTLGCGLELVELHFILQLLFKQLEAISLHFQVSLGLYTAVQAHPALSSSTAIP